MKLWGLVDGGVISWKAVTKSVIEKETRAVKISGSLGTHSTEHRKKDEKAPSYPGGEGLDVVSKLSAVCLGQLGERRVKGERNQAGQP